MDINSTLLVQACNFIICYIFLKKVLFRTAADTITKDEREHETIHAGIVGIEQAITKENDQQDKMWHQAHKLLNAEQPLVTSRHFYTPKAQPFDVEKKAHDDIQEQKDITEKIVAYCKDGVAND